MMGKRSAQDKLFAADHVYLDFVGRDTLYGYLAQNRELHFPGHLSAAFWEGRQKLGQINSAQSAGIHGAGHLTVRNGQVPSLKLNANLMKLAWPCQKRSFLI